MPFDMDDTLTLTIERACQIYEDSVDATYAARRNAEVCRDYYDGKQWTAEEQATLNKRKQPVITNNRIAPKVDFLLGAERQGRTDPRAYPRNPSDDGAAEAATDALRYATDKAKFSDTRSEVFENVLIEGFGGAIVEVEKRKENFEIVIRRIPWDRLFYDPHSRRRDFKDARYLGVVTWMDKAEAIRLYPGKKKEIEDAIGPAESSETYDDKPRHYWRDGKRQRIKCVEIYWQGKTWMRGVYTQGSWLEPLEASPYVDEDGEPVNPIELVSAFVDRDNNRYGPVFRYISPQDSINKRESKSLHLMSVRQTWGNRQAIDDIAKTRAELAKPDGHIEINAGTFGQDFGVLPTGDMAASQFQLLQQALQNLDASGANAALQGKQEGQQSGRALQARQQGGQIELGPIFDGLHQWSTRIYEQTWMRIKQYWKAPMWIRVTDDEQKLKYVGLNQQTTVGEQIVEQAKSKKMPLAQMQQLVQQIAQDPRAQLPATQNDLSRMDVDIVIDASPDVVTLQGEQFQMISEMYKANPKNAQNPEGIPFEVVLETSAYRDKQKLLEKMKGGAEQSPEQQQAAQEAQQFQKAMAMADLQLKQAHADKIKAETAKTMREAQAGPQQPEQQGPEALIKAQTDIQTATIKRDGQLEAEQIKAVNNLQRMAMQQDGETQRELIRIAGQPEAVEGD